MKLINSRMFFFKVFLFSFTLTAIQSNSAHAASQAKLSEIISALIIADSIKEINANIHPFIDSNKTFSGRELYDSSVQTIPSDLTAEMVIERYLSALGGRENFEKINDRITKITGSMSGINFEMTIYQKEPNKLKQIIKAGDVNQKIVYDGTNGYSSMNGNKMEISAAELEKLKYESIFKLLLYLNEYAVRLNLIGIEEINGMNAYEIELLLPGEIKWIQYYDTTTGLKIKEKKFIILPHGTFTQETYFDDFREIDGIKYPFLIKQTLGSQSMEFNVKSIEINKGLIDREFEGDE
jgi:phosphotransferase system IIB component